MTRHNNDISACDHATCPSRHTCLRWIIGQQQIKNYQWFGRFEHKDGQCEYFMRNKPNNDNDNEND